MRKTVKILLPLFLILAVIGIFNNISGFFSVIGMTVTVGLLFYLGYRFYLSKRYRIPMFSKSKNGPTRAQMKKAKRTSTVSSSPKSKPQNFPKNNRQSELNQKRLKKVPKRRSAPHLKVIEGKGGKATTKTNKKKA